MAHDRRHQKKLEKQRKKRTAKARASMAVHRPSSDIVRIAARSQIEAAYLSKGWQESDGDMPTLVTAILLRRLPSGQLLPVVALVDRSCLGLKNGMIGRPIADWEVPAFLQRMGKPHGGMEPCEPLVAQSLIFHALDYARSLGFLPHQDVPLALLGPRPEVLIDTPLCRPEKPHYASGPHDDVRRVLATLDRTVGRGGYHFFVEAGQFSPTAGELQDEDDDDELEDED